MRTADKPLPACNGCTPKVGSGRSLLTCYSSTSLCRPRSPGRPGRGEQGRGEEAEVRLAAIHPELQLWQTHGHAQHCGQHCGRQEVRQVMNKTTQNKIECCQKRESNESNLSLVETFSLVLKCKIHFGYSNWNSSLFARTSFCRTRNPFIIILLEMEVFNWLPFSRLSVDVGVGWGVTQARLDRASFSYNYRFVEIFYTKPMRVLFGGYCSRGLRIQSCVDNWQSFHLPKWYWS